MLGDSVTGNGPKRMNFCELNHCKNNLNCSLSSIPLRNQTHCSHNLPPVGGPVSVLQEFPYLVRYFSYLSFNWSKSIVQVSIYQMYLCVVSHSLSTWVINKCSYLLAAATQLVNAAFQRNISTKVHERPPQDFKIEFARAGKVSGRNRNELRFPKAGELVPFPVLNHIGDIKLRDALPQPAVG